MDDINNRGIILMNDYVYGFRGRSHFTNLTLKRKTFDQCVVYCHDLTLRKILRHEEMRLEPPFWSLLFFNPFYSGIPILSEPIGTYEFRELKLLVAKRIRHMRHSIVAGGPELKAQLERATTFDDLLDLVSPILITR